MTLSPLSRCRVLLIFLAVFFQAATGLCSSDALEGQEFNQLKQRLVKDGFTKEKIDALFDGKKVVFTPNGVSLFFIHSESSLNYDQFAGKESIAKAKAYLDRHHTTLDKAEKAYGVDKTIIVAILLVETRLGTYLGNRIVINTLATMASLSDDKLKERIFQNIPKKKRPAREAFDKKVRRRSDWGYKELKALLTYTEKEQTSPESIKGSYAGAMGISQFMPSNALRLAKDGDNDGRVDLFTHDDAIFSVANYLKHHGWTPDLPRQKQKKVLHRYNHSNYYVNILLKISDKLKG